MVLLWEAELSSKEMPPEWMRPIPWEVEKWMAKVNQARRKKYGIKDDEATDYDDNPDYTRNELIPDWARE